MDNIGRDKSEVVTPSLLLDLDVVDQNIRKMAEFFATSSCRLRPHAKTHKLPYIARKQVQSGALGITCAKLEDAKAFVGAGIDNILIANQVVSPRKMEELVNLNREAVVLVCIDQEENASHLSRTAEKAGLQLGVLIEVDVGLGRCGVQPGEPALKLLRRIEAMRGLSFQGLMGYEGALFNADASQKLRLCRQRNQLLVETKDLLQRGGHEVKIVSAGGSNTYQVTGRCPGITEVQPGSYVTMDDWNSGYGIPFGQAISVLTTVISRPTAKQVVTDAGLKALSTDHGPSRISRPAGVAVEALNEEHGRLQVTEPSLEPRVGQTLEIVPSHGCTTIPLYEKYLAVRNGVVVEELSIISRGATY